MQQTRLDETDGYLAAREELRLAEIELMRHRERVAELRRRLPQGAAVQDYAFEEVPGGLDGEDAPATTVRLSELFTGPGRSLIVYHLMFGKAQTVPCPMCTMWLDGFNGIAHHVAQNADLVVVAAAAQPELRTFARWRGWRNLRLLSAGSSTFKHDLDSENDSGDQHSTISVFSRDGSGIIRHSYTAHPALAGDVHERGIDALCPVWHLLDLTREGRGDWYAQLRYPDTPATTAR